MHENILPITDTPQCVSYFSVKKYMYRICTRVVYNFGQGVFFV